VKTVQINQSIDDINKKLEALDPTGGVIYLKGEPDNPNLRDWRIVADGMRMHFERYAPDTDEWERFGTEGGSSMTDRLILMQLNGHKQEILGLYYVLENDVKRVIWKLTSLEGGVEYGDITKATYLTSDSEDSLYQSHADGVWKGVEQSLDNQNIPAGHYEYTFTFSHTEHVMSEYLIYNILSPVKGRLTIKDVATDRFVYTTSSNADYEDTGGKDIWGYPLNDSGYADITKPMQQTGLIAVPLSYQFFFNPNKEYKVDIYYSTGEVKGGEVEGSPVPYVEIQGIQQSVKTIATREWIEANLASSAITSPSGNKKAEVTDAQFLYHDGIRQRMWVDAYRVKTCSPDGASNVTVDNDTVSMMGPTVELRDYNRQRIWTDGSASQMFAPNGYNYMKVNDSYARMRGQSVTLYDHYRARIWHDSLTSKMVAPNSIEYIETVNYTNTMKGSNNHLRDHTRIRMKTDGSCTKMIAPNGVSNIYVENSRAYIQAPTTSLYDYSRQRVYANSSETRTVSPSGNNYFTVDNNLVKGYAVQGGFYDTVRGRLFYSNLNSQVASPNGQSYLYMDNNQLKTYGASTYFRDNSRSRLYFNSSRTRMVSPNGVCHIETVNNDGIFKGVYFRPEASAMILGHPGVRWRELFVDYANVSNSDRRLKRDIEDLTEAELKAFSKLRPVTFDRIDDKTDAKCIGFIAQEVEATFKEYGLRAKDYYFLNYNKRDKNEDIGDKTIYDEHGIDDVYGIAYSEFVALNLAYSQMLEKKLDATENKLDAIDSRLQAIEDKKTVWQTICSFFKETAEKIKGGHNGRK